MVIPNHVTSRISDLDMRTAIAVPPGGNWKNIPDDIPLARLETIRRGFAEGRGSRSTYYGRLHPDRPSYTINTHFTRPGNGCHLHYDYDGGQHRTLSFREAARLQSFPDDFIFFGPKTSIAQQIGNAVPPLLAYQIALSLGRKAMFVDLFSGAGGLGLGFMWAGWRPVVANDVEPRFIETYEHNHSSPGIVGDLRDPDVFAEVLAAAKAAQKRAPRTPLWVLGGPPCQGFSTAGKRRSMEDERNHLFKDYARFIEELRPDGFLFENVSGLLNMEKGAVFKQVRETLSEVMPYVDHWIVDADRYGVPQRRRRVILIGHQLVSGAPEQPAAVTSMDGEAGLFGAEARVPSVRDALGDLPPLGNGEDGSDLEYIGSPQTTYQELMRGFIDPDAYLKSLNA